MDDKRHKKNYTRKLIRVKTTNEEQTVNRNEKLHDEHEQKEAENRAWINNQNEKQNKNKQKNPVQS